MTKQTIPVSIPAGFEFNGFDTKTNEVLLKEKAKHERIKTIADVLADNGLTQEEFEKQCAGLEPDEVGYRLAKLIAKSLNEGWTPDWNDDDQYKYVPYFYTGGSSGFRFSDFDYWNSYSYVGSRLCFRSAELARYAGTQFTDVYKQFML